MLNYIWLALVLGAALIGGMTGKLKAVADGAVSGAETAVTLSLGLIGVMTLWLGIMRLAEVSGAVRQLALTLKPLMRRLFPDVPVDHPAMGSMVMNIAANMIGLVNAATPLGLRAMRDLQTLNKTPGAATNAMCTFLAINTGSVQLIPITAISILTAAKSANPTAIVGTALAATLCSSIAGLVTVKTLEKLPFFAIRPAGSEAEIGPQTAIAPEKPLLAPEPIQPLSAGGKAVLAIYFALFAWFVMAMVDPAGFAIGQPSATNAEPLVVRIFNAISVASVTMLLTFMPLYAALRKIKVYEEFIEGAKEGFGVAVKIIPYLVTMLAAISMFRAAGGIAMLTQALSPVLTALRFPPELVPITLVRPLSGSGALALFSDIVRQYGPDNLLSRMAGTIYGSTETTFYVVAVYFGAVGVRQTRHAIPAGLAADLAGAIAAVFVCRLVFG